MAWTLHVFYEAAGFNGNPHVDQVTYDVTDKPTLFDYSPPLDPAWGSRGGDYRYVWYNEALVEIPPLIGRTRQLAEALLQDLDVQVNFQNNADPPLAEVLAQSLPPGTLVAQGATITITVGR